MEKNNNLSTRLWNFYSQNVGTIALVAVVAVVTLAVAISVRAPTIPKSRWQTQVDHLRHFVSHHPIATALVVVSTLTALGIAGFYGHRYARNRWILNVPVPVVAPVTRFATAVAFLQTHARIIAIVVATIIGLYLVYQFSTPVYNKIKSVLNFR